MSSPKRSKCCHGLTQEDLFGDIFNHLVPDVPFPSVRKEAGVLPVLLPGETLRSLFALTDPHDPGSGGTGHSLGGA